MSRFKPSAIHFVSLSEKQKQAWDRDIARSIPQDIEKLTFVSDLEQLLQQEQYNFFVTPGNSYGIMSGGYDGAIIDIFGQELEEVVKQHIRDHYAGECQVGNAFVVRIPGQVKKYLVYAPTMRVPKSLAINDDVVYRSVWSALCAVEGWVRDNMVDPAVSNLKVLFTAHGGATGNLPPELISWQMMYAIHRHFIRRPINNLFVDGNAHNDFILHGHEM